MRAAVPRSRKRIYKLGALRAWEGHALESHLESDLVEAVRLVGAGVGAGRCGNGSFRVIFPTPP